MINNEDRIRDIELNDYLDNLFRDEDMEKQPQDDPNWYDDSLDDYELI